MGFFGKLLGKEDRDDSFDLGKDHFANDSGTTGQGTGMGADPLSGQGMGMSGADPLSESASQPSSFGDPMGSSFQADPSLQSNPPPTQSAYPSAAVPIPGQNRGMLGDAHSHYDDDAPSRDVELILAKLDAIKAELDSVHQRVKKLEAASDAQHQQQTQQQTNDQVHQKYGW